MCAASKNDVITLETDVAVIGGGGAGLSAAVAAAEKGVRVIVLEKRFVTGGNSIFAEALFASESRLQHLNAIDVRNDDMFKMAMSYAHLDLNATVMRAFINKSGDTIRWLQEKGVVFTSIPPFSSKQVLRVFHNPEKGGRSVIDALLKCCSDLGVRLLTGVAVEKILKNQSGSIDGIIAATPNAKFRIKAKSCIIATGGYLGNKKLLKKHMNPYTDDFDLPGMPYQGDGLMMAYEAGVAAEGLGRVQASGPHFRGKLPMMGGLIGEPDALWLNKNGKRFLDEANCFIDFEVGNAILRQPGKFCYAMVDHKKLQDVMEKGFNKIYLAALHPNTGPVPPLEPFLQLMDQGLALAEQVISEKCTGCGVCFNNCMENAIELNTSSIENEVAPCQYSCPAGVDIRRYLNLYKKGKMDEAIEVMKESLPLPAVTGRVCPHFCEGDCSRNEVDAAVNINSLERYLADALLKEQAKPISPQYSQKVAIIGSGPSGLSCAYFLTRLGYPVTVFEAKSALGGMLRIGIPEYRLPKKILDKQINYIRDMGVEFKTAITVGKDITFESLKSNFQAIFLAYGNQLSRQIKLEGSQLKGVFWGLEFLSAANRNGKFKIKGKVVVIGGGNVAMDAALTALRCGAQEVQIACLEKGDELPAYKEEIERAIAEGICIREGWGPQAITGDGQKVTGIELVRCTQVYDAKGKFAPSYDTTRTEKIKTDMVILAVGQSPDHSLAPQGLTFSENGTLRVDPLTLATSLDGVFAGGDVITGAGSVVRATADGKTAAVSIDRFLCGRDLKEGRPKTIRKVKNVPHKGILTRPRIDNPLLPVEKTRRNFNEVKMGFDDLLASQEVQRCLTCGSHPVIDIDKCKLCMTCQLNCPEKALNPVPVKKVQPEGKICQSLKEAAEWMEISTESLENTIGKYNMYCEKGEDIEFAKDRRYLKSIDTPPYYIFKCNVVFLTTMGGLRINEDMEAVNDDDIPIPGLFAAGNDTAGFESSTYNVLLPGSTFGYAINSGRIAGESAVKYIKKDSLR
jgi:NADPH-dependent glutamate synthase beta subunit-like oxidoreductase